jgi:hypothetical protein
MRWIGWTGAAVAIVLACGAGASAQAAWQAYHNVKYGFSVEIPSDPRITEKTTAGSDGPVSGLSGAIDLHERGALVFTVVDYSATSKSNDPDTVMEALAKALVQKDESVLDSEISIIVHGSPGRDIVAHTGVFQRRVRIVYRNQRLYGLIGVGPVSSGAPAEFERFAGSLRFDSGS